MSELTEAGREARRIYMREWQRKHRTLLRDKQNNYWNKVGAQMEAEEGRRVHTMVIEARDYCPPHAPVMGKARGRMITNLATSQQLLGVPDDGIIAGALVIARDLCENYGKGFGDEEVINIVTKVLREVDKGELWEGIEEMAGINDDD